MTAATMFLSCCCNLGSLDRQLHSRTPLSMLLLGCDIFLRLLPSVQAGVVAGIVPRHHDVLEVLVLHCHTSDRFLSNVSTAHACQPETYLSQEAPVACLMRKSRLAAQACSLAARMTRVPTGVSKVKGAVASLRTLCWASA
jgi:hypothetical protein